MSTKKVLNGKGVVTCHRTVDGGEGAFLSFSSHFFLLFSPLFSLTSSFVFLSSLSHTALFFGPYRNISKKKWYL